MCAHHGWKHSSDAKLKVGSGIPEPRRPTAAPASIAAVAFPAHTMPFKERSMWVYGVHQRSSLDSQRHILVKISRFNAW